jgi:hypothetical protein
MPYWQREVRKWRLTSAGRCHPWDPQWRPELLPDVDRSWGKRSTLDWGVSTQKESANGWANCQLAGGEWAAVLTWLRGKKWQRARYFPPAYRLYRWRRERWSGWVPRVGNGLRHWAGLANHVAHVCVPYFGWHESGWLSGCTFQTQPVIKHFLYFPKWTECVNWKDHPYVAPKFNIICISVEHKIRNNFPFGMKFKFKTELEVKILEIELNLKLIWIYWWPKLI